MARKIARKLYRKDLVTARKDLNLTQAEMATFIGVSTSAYQKYELYERSPQPPYADRLESFLKFHKQFMLLLRIREGPLDSRSFTPEERELYRQSLYTLYQKTNEKLEI